MSTGNSNETDLQEEHTENWATLVDHIQAKVLKRTSDVSYLHTKAGFLIAADVVLLQIMSGLEKPHGSLALVGLITAAILTLISLGLSVASMVMNKSATPLNIDDMILLMHKGHMTRLTFSKWLIDCYNLANKEFNKVYTRKYYLQLSAATILVIAIILTLVLKGVELYVKH